MICLFGLARISFRQRERNGQGRGSRRMKRMTAGRVKVANRVQHRHREHDARSEQSGQNAIDEQSALEKKKSKSMAE